MSFACESAKPPTRTESSPIATEVDVDRELARVCEDARTHDQPVLLEFTADWCGDCRRLHEMKTRAPLTDELAHWTSHEFDVGRFDRYERLRKHFDIRSIAFWAALRPTDCASAVEAWPQLGVRVVEPKSDPSLGPSQLVDWLQTQRERQL